MNRSVLVTGATGQLGRVLVPMLAADGWTVRTASRSAPPPGADRERWHTVDYVTGTGLAESLDGVDVVVHTASGSPRGEKQTSAALVRELGRQAVQPHLVYISIVGVDRNPMVYYRAKLAAERAFAAAGLPLTVLRATQYHSLLHLAVRALSRLPVVLLAPKGLTFQTISVQAVARRLADLAAGDPQGRVADIGGPELRSMPDLAESYLRMLGRSRRIVEIPVPGGFVAAMRRGSNLAPDGALPGLTFEEYVADLPADRR